MKNIIVSTLLLAVTFGSTNSPAQSANTVVWNGGTGNWSNAALWNTGVVPNGVGVSVFVDGGKTKTDSVVDMDGGFTVGELTIDAGDAVFVGDNNTFTVDAGSPTSSTTLANAGTLTFNSVGEYTTLNLNGIVTLNGGGVVNVTVAARFLGAGTLVNVDNTIQGDTSGANLGFDQIALVNQTAGVIAATAANGAALVLDPGAGGLTNAGTLMASGGGTLVLSGYNVGTFANTGLIEALDKSQVQLAGGAVLSGGVLSTTGSGTILETGGATISDLTLQGTLDVQDNSTLNVGGTITNNGTLNLASVGEYTTLNLNGDTTLAGTGTVNVTVAARFLGAGTLTIGAGQTIQGNTSGANLGFDQIALVNAGVIDANTAGGVALVLDPGAGNLTNAGTLMASGGGTLVLSGYNVGTFANTGLIEALDKSQVQLAGGAVLSGGVLSTTGSGTILETGGATISDLTLQGTLDVQDNSTLNVGGTITNNGTLNLASVGEYTTLNLNGIVTLNGGGVVNVTVAARFLGAGTLVNVDNTIQGDTSGANLGFDQIALVNQTAGVIAATAANGAALVLDPGAGGLTNAGTLMASGGGTLVLSGYNVGTFANTGLIEALDKSQVQLAGGAVLSGGVLSTTGSGTILETGGATISDLTLQGTLDVQDNSTLNVGGTITNNGTLNLASVGEYTTLNLNGDTTLAGTGTVNVTVAARFLGAGTLTIGAGQTIQGNTSGANLGFDQIALVNAGVIDANTAGGVALVLDPGAGNLTNNGTLMASNGGTLVLSGYNVGQTINNGVLDAEAGSSINIDQNGLANFSNGVLTGGTYQVTSGVAGAATLTLDGSNLPTSVTNAATVILSGPNSNLPVFQNLTDNQGSLTLLALRQFTTAGDLSNEGTIFLDAGCTLHVTGNFTASGASSPSSSSPANLHPQPAAATPVSILQFVLGGTAAQGVLSAGALQVSGTAHMAGLLELAFADAAALPGAGDTMSILSAKKITGSFDNAPSGTRLTTKDGRGSFVITYGGSSIGLSGFLAPGQTETTPIVSIAVVGDGEAVEGGENGKVAIRRDGDTTNALTVRYKVVGGVVAGVDYKALSGVAVIPAGAAQVKVKIKPIGGDANEGTRVAKIKLKAASDGSYVLGSPTAAKVKITDNN